MPYRHLIYQKHAFRRMAERLIPPHIVRQVLSSGEIIETYPDDLPYPSYLLFTYVDKRPIHVVTADNHEMKVTHIITAYQPSVVEWETGFRKRLPK